jgi:hypothetical protein
MAKFTAGPWVVGRDEFPNEDQVYGPDRIIVGSAHPSRKEVKANARLIAAAPDMYEAIKAVADELSGHVEEVPTVDTSLDWCFDRLRTALSKVEGVEGE